MHNRTPFHVFSVHYILIFFFFAGKRILLSFAGKSNRACNCTPLLVFRINSARALNCSLSHSCPRRNATLPQMLDAHMFEIKTSSETEKEAKHGLADSVCQSALARGTNFRGRIFQISRMMNKEASVSSPSQRGTLALASFHTDSTLAAAFSKPVVIFFFWHKYVDYIFFFYFFRFTYVDHFPFTTV